MRLLRLKRQEKKLLSKDDTAIKIPVSYLIGFAVTAVAVSFVSGVGEFIFTLNDHPYRRAIINDLVKTQKWIDQIIPRQYNNLTTEEYFDVISNLSGDFEIWETTYCHRMPSYESIIEWYKGTGLRPYLEQLSDSDADEFVNDVYNELKARYKTQKNGEILFRFPRLFFVITNQG